MIYVIKTAKNKTTYIAILGLILFLSACSSDDKWQPVTSTVESIEFKKSENNQNMARIETEKEVLMVYIHAVDARTTNNGDSNIKITKRSENPDDWLIIREQLFNDKRPYELIIPEEQLKQISTKYAEAFNETFEHKPK